MITEGEIERMEKLMDAIKAIIPKGLGILVYDKTHIKEEELKNLVYGILACKGIIIKEEEEQ
jgi:hypothetical protein